MSGVSREHPTAFAIAWVVLALLMAPLVVIIGVSLNESPQQLFPPEGLSLRWYLVAAQRSEFHDALALSLGLATVTTLSSLLIGTLTALAITRYSFAGHNALQVALLSPLVIPQVVIGMAFLLLLTQMQVVGSLLGLSVLHVVLTLPFTTRVMTATLLSADVLRERAARSLGAGPIRAFMLVTLPMIRPGLTTAAVFAFVISFDNFTATQFVIWHHPTLPVEIYHYIRTESDPTVAAISSLLMLAIGLVVIVVNRYAGLDMVTGRGSRRR